MAGAMLSRGVAVAARLVRSMARVRLAAAGRDWIRPRQRGVERNAARAGRRIGIGLALGAAVFGAALALYDAARRE